MDRQPTPLRFNGGLRRRGASDGPEQETVETEWTSQAKVEDSREGCPSTYNGKTLGSISKRLLASVKLH